MAEEDQDQKTEEPTGKRLDEARERGQIPLSRETASWILFLGILTVVAWLAPPMASKLIGTLKIYLEMPDQILLEDRGIQTVMYNTLTQVAMETAMIFIVLFAAAILGHVLQTGLMVSFELIKPDITKLSFLKGIKRIISVSSLVELAKSIAKLVLLGLIAYMVLLPVARALPAMMGHPFMDIIAYMHHEAVHLIVMLLMVFTGVAIADLLYQRFTYYKNLRMTKTEVKDEYKQQEGDPLIKQRLRTIRLEKARKRMMAQVPKADVVITNPTHYAIALQYVSGKMTAPLVLAKGIDRVAERIRDVAEENRIPLVSNPPLSRALYETVEIDEEIPTQHYRAVAEVISYVYKLKNRKF